MRDIRKSQDQNFLKQNRGKNQHWHQTGPRQDAVFIGWQRTTSGAPFPLYNITVKGHPSFGSTVTSKTLHDLGLRIPQTMLPPNQAGKP